MRDSRALALRGHIAGLDILRGIAVGSVVVFHAFRDSGYRGQGSKLGDLVVRFSELGHLGVYLFFVLSGFLITGILLRQRDKPRYYRSFYTRRALRILPAYVLLLLVLKLVGEVHWPYILACALFIANMASLVHSHTYEYGVLWTLAVEEQFYLLWPTVLRHILGVRVLLACAAAGIVIAPMLRLILPGISHIDAYTFTPSNMDPLLLGALCAVTIEYGIIHRGNIGRITLVLWIAGALLSLPLLGLDAFPHPHSPTFWLWWNAWYRSGPLCLFVAAVLLAVEKAQKPALRGPIAGALMFLGYISYGLYLVHPLLFSTYDRVFAGSWLGQSREAFVPLCLRFLIAGTASVVVATLSRRYYEELFLRRKRTLAPETAEPAGGGIPGRS